MTPSFRTGLSVLSLALQFMAMVSAMAVISFFLPAVGEFLKVHEGKFAVPAPTRLLIENPAVAQLVVVGLFAASVGCFLFTRCKMKEEADRLAIQSVVNAAVWYLGIIYVGGVLMALALPYFALN